MPFRDWFAARSDAANDNAARVPALAVQMAKVPSETMARLKREWR